jgi:hypothetical protein
MRGKMDIFTYVSASALDVRVTGEKHIETERLKSITKFDCSDDNEIVGRFWRAFERMSFDERAAYLKFVWGRNRLPISLESLSHKHEVRLMGHLSDTGFPLSHTCFF